MTRSSTSSSDGWRRALAPGVVALVLLVGLDAVLDSSAVWQGLETRVERGRRAGFVVRLESRLARLSHATEARLRVVVLGNSRAMAAIDPEGLRDAHVSVIARPGLEAFQQRSLAERVARGRPDAVIVAWSEFDTHRPVRLEPVVGRAVASASALLDLLGETDARFVWRNRDTLLRASLASLSNGYRYREVLGEAFGFAWRRFPTSSLLRVPPPPPLAGRARIAFWDAEPPAVPESVRREARDLYYPPAATLTALRQIDMVSEIRRGRHVEVQTALLRRTVEKLHDAGIVVIVVRDAVVIIGIMHFALRPMNVRSRLSKLSSIFFWRHRWQVLKKSYHRPNFLIRMSVPERGHAGHLHAVLRDPKQLRGVPLVHFFRQDWRRRI